MTVTGNEGIRRRRGRRALALLAGVLLPLLPSNGAPPVEAAAWQAQGTGLVFADPDVLRSVPLASIPYSGTELPARVDLSSKLPPPGSQGSQQSCVGWAVAYALKSYQEVIETATTVVTSDGRARADRVFSPAFIYNQINQGRDGGSSIIDALRVLEDQGAATWADFPYDPADHTRQPTTETRQRARRYRIDYWRQVNPQSTKDLKAHLNAGFPVIIGALVDTGFLQAGRGHVWRRAEGETTGGHAMLVVGYDDARAAFMVINSWGPAWGDAGFGWIAYDHFLRVTREAYVAKDAITAADPTVTPDVPDPDPPEPEPPTDPSRGLSFSVIAANNAAWPDRPDLGPLLRFDGVLTIPPGAGRANQSVIHFYFDDGAGGKGAPVPGLLAGYVDVHGMAACGTAAYAIPPEGISTTWAAWIPYQALGVPEGQWVNAPGGARYQPRITWLVAEPVLFIDGFGVLSGGLFRFSVQR